MICECCGDNVADLDAHYPCDCKECFNRLWLVSFTLPVASNPKKERHVAAKIEFTATKFTMTYQDGSTQGFQSDLLESILDLSISPLKKGTLKHMPAEERHGLVTGIDNIFEVM